MDVGGGEGVSQGTQVSRSVHVNQRGVRVLFPFLSFSSPPPSLLTTSGGPAPPVEM